MGGARKILPAIAVVAAVLLGGCGTVGGGPSGPTLVEPTSAAPGGETASETASTVRTARIGQSYRWDNGMQATVTVSTARTSGYGEPPNSSVAVVRVKLTNGTGKIFNPVGCSVQLTYGKDGTEANDMVGDPDHPEWSNLFSAQILPGRSKTGIYAFALAKNQLGSAEVQVTPDIEYDTAFFTY